MIVRVLMSVTTDAGDNSVLAHREELVVTGTEDFEGNMLKIKAALASMKEGAFESALGQMDDIAEDFHTVHEPGPSSSTGRRGRRGR